MLRLKLAAFLAIICTNVIATTFQPSGVPFRNPVVTAPGLTASVVFSNLTAPRGITFDSEGNLLVVERGFGVTALSAVTGGFERTVVIESTAFTQGIQVDGTDLYVSTAGEVLLYQYNPATKSVTAGIPQSVITGVPADGELTTHALLLEKDGEDETIGILVGSGPLTNIDPTARDPASGRSQVRRFVLPATGGQSSWSSGQVVAYGIRNPGGFAFSPSGSKLYIVENGASIDNVTGLTEAFVNDNPADELNVIDWPPAPNSTPKFFGFPDCTTLWNPEADPTGVPDYLGLDRGDQISLKLIPQRDDAWCADEENNARPNVVFQAHSVPLDIKFYEGPQTSTPASLPSAFIGDPFVSFRGSFDRDPPTGYGVVRVKSSLPNGYEFIVQTADLSLCPGSCIRPVGLAFAEDGTLFVSSDASQEVFVVEKQSS
ncbi:nhl repeat-containing protein [Moniliophthora roreri MCA 2997]|uniref:Nhl repeat-containing protein n=2 Tax=Moniliophthora roreri TaxID=221103 RepID=V2YLU2_MONRO|nr:nhl repeat-containing protein [Moniliophthora roreri MCA 2997]KAI3612933.1 nhl repeat-containing protein [Moniliophthora roreri]